MMSTALFWFLATSYLQGVFVQSKIVIFDPQPSDQDVRDGDFAVLHCGVAEINSNHYNFSWLFGGIPIKYDQRRFQNGSSLYIQPIKKELDDNEFRCIATNTETAQEHYSHFALFNTTWIRVQEVYLKRPANSSSIRASMKSFIVLKCGITGNPSPRIFRWFVDSKLLKFSNGVSVRKDRLKIERPQALIYNGIYTCCAENPVNGSFVCTPTERGFDLKILDLRTPVLIQAPKNVVVRRGSNAFLHCEFRSQPPTTIVWRRKGTTKPLGNRPKSGKCTRRCLYPNGTIALYNVRETTAADYECVAKQGDTFSRVLSASVQLAYLHPFGEQESVKYVTLGRKVEYHCDEPKALPKANITWMRLRDNAMIVEGNNHVSRVKNILVIDNVEQADLGAYKCIASNVAGTNYMTLVLQLAETHVFGDLLPKTANEGDNVTWICPILGTVVAEVVWLKDGVEVISDVKKNIIHGLELTLISVDKHDEGLYACTLKFKRENSQGRSGTARFTVNGSHTLQRQSGGTLSLVFNRTKKSDIGSYRCEARFQSDKIQNVINITVVPSPLVTRGLQTVKVSLGESIILDCPMVNIERNKVRWNITLRPGDEVERYSLLRNGSLGIYKTKVRDNGIYRCSYIQCGLETQAFTRLIVVKAFNDVSMPPLLLEPTDTSQAQHIIALSVVGGIAHLACIVMVVYCCRRKYRKKSVEKSRPGEEEKMLSDVYTDPLVRSSKDDVMSVRAFPDLLSLNAQLSAFDYPFDSISPVTVIGKGEFGDIFLSKAPGLFPDLEDDILVMVKSLDWPQITEKRCNFYQEVNLLRQSNHENLVKLLAVCFDSTHPPSIQYLITEYLEWGILKLCLEASNQNQMSKFTKKHKMAMCCQIACALDHLEGIGLRHNDVATRNCVVSSHLVKLSILGLNEEGFENEYYQVDRKRLPVRWMAPEALFKGQYSSKSDVWSFAVTCWEIFTLGQLPYDNYTNEQFIQALHCDSPPVLPALENSKRITSLIKKCCQINPRDRPDIKQIMRKLKSIVGSSEKSGDVTNEESCKSDNLTDTSSEKFKPSEKG